MGRPQKSQVLHELHGTRNHAGKNESAFVAGRPKIPSHLCKAARTEFKRVCQILEQRGTVTPGEATTLALYAEIYSRWIDIKRAVAKEYMVEITVLDNNGIARTSRRLNPLFKPLESCESRLLALAKSLGLTPVDRNRSKLTALNPQLEIVPGSAADVMPWLVDTKLTLIRPTTPESVEPSQMVGDDEPPVSEGEEQL